MSLVITSKNKDFSTWRAAGDFALTCRNMLLEKTAMLSSEQAEALYEQVERELDRRTAAHEECLERLRQQEGRIAVGPPAALVSLLEEFYAGCYEFFRCNHSAAAFYHLSQSFLCSAAAILLAAARRQAGIVQVPLALVSLGPAGREEYSPFCPLHLVLIHGEVTAQQAESVAELGRLLHESFEAAGLPVDGDVTPRNASWRGSMSEWRRRLSQSLEPGRFQNLPLASRLSDQRWLVSEEGLAEQFKDHCLSLLQQFRPVLAFQVARIMDLSTGLGIMGGFRLERKGDHRGLFGLLDHALLPLSASISTLALIKGVTAQSTPQRVRDLLAGGEIDVEMAERLLNAWHYVHELRLGREADLMPDRTRQDAGFIDVLALPEQQQERLKGHLEAVHTLQRHVGIIFSGWEEQS